jgi:hypothetical protein
MYECMDGYVYVYYNNLQFASVNQQMKKHY